MSQRLSCLSTDFGLHLIRTIAGFISSMFVCRLNESSYKDSSSSYPSSPSSSFSSSQSSPVLFTLTSQPPKSFILKSSSSSSPNDEKQRKHRQKRCQHKSFKSTENGDENYCDDYQTSEEYANEDTVGDQTTGDRTVIDQNPPPRQMEKRLKVTEKELSYLNHKIEKLLVKLEEEYETEIAATPDEECVICISAKATMQTFPCAHRVVCRKCFVKMIQMVVSQRMLPLRCVICRAKVLRLKQTTTGGLSTGYVRSNKRGSTPDIYSIDAGLASNHHHHHYPIHQYHHNQSHRTLNNSNSSFFPTTPTSKNQLKLSSSKTWASGKGQVRFSFR